MMVLRCHHQPTLRRREGGWRQIVEVLVGRSGKENRLRFIGNDDPRWRLT
jgi:hypothetical protein